MRINATAKTALIQELIFSSHNYFAIVVWLTYDGGDPNAITEPNSASLILRHYVLVQIAFHVL